MLQGRGYAGYAKVEPISRWIVLSSGLEAEVFASAREVGLTVFGISVAALILISLIVVRFANGIIGSLLSLVDYAKQVSEGDFDTRLEATTRDDELGVLHNSLERLVDTLQSMLFQTQEASRIKGEFLANMSHEIRTPINAIIGMTHLSLRESDMSEKQRDYLEKIQTAARSLLGVINDILDISKIEAGKLVLENVPFNMRQILEDTLSIHQINAHTKSLSLTLDCAADVPKFLIGDPLRIGQVLNNLLSNAVKFTREGSVSIHCSLIDENEQGAQVRIDVTDTGIGMTQESIDKLFQPFTQADASITRQFGGTGLGLAISASLLHLMGGELGVTSELGAGSRFSILLRLPVDRSIQREQADEMPTTEDFERLRLGGKVILIAEDNTINQMILEELIAPSRATILLVENGEEALASVQKQHVDLVFMDMQMPVMDGLQATKAIRALPGMDALPIIAVTANAMKEDREEGFASGMNDYITKPIELRQLYATLQTWLAAEN